MAIGGLILRALGGFDVNKIPTRGLTPGAPASISNGDEVQVLTAPNGIACTVLTGSGTAVRVVTASAKQIHVLIDGGTPIRVTI